MKPSPRNKAYISQLTACVMAAVFCFAVSTFAVVWQHQSNVRIAKENNELDNTIASIARHHTEILKQVADEQTFEKLISRNASFALNLAPIREQQLIRVTIDPKLRLEMKRNLESIGHIPVPRPAPARPAAETDARPATIRFVTLTR